MTKRPRLEAPSQMRAGDVTITCGFTLEDPSGVATGPGDERSSLTFIVDEAGYQVRAKNPDCPDGVCFIRETTPLTVDGALEAMLHEQSYSPGLHGFDASTDGYDLVARDMPDWMRELLLVGYVFPHLAQIMQGFTVQELAAVRARFDHDLATDASVAAFGQLCSAIEGTRLVSLTLGQLAEAAGVTDPIDLEALAERLQQVDDSI